MSEFDDPFSLHAQSRPSGRRDEEGREIRLVGPTVLAMEINGDHSAVPDEYVAHPLISGRHFYALPLGLLEAIVTTIGEERFQQDTLRMERELGAICDESQIVGFAQGRGLRYEELQLAEFESFWDLSKSKMV